MDLPSLLQLPVQMWSNKLAEAWLQIHLIPPLTHSFCHTLSTILLLMARREVKPMEDVLEMGGMDPPLLGKEPLPDDKVSNFTAIIKP